MRRLWLILALVAWAAPASAQNCVTINGVSRCAAPWQIYDTTVRSLSLPVIDLSQTWNAPGVTFTGWKINIADTNSAAGSLLVDLQVGGVSKFSITKAGAVTSGATSALGTTSTDGAVLQNTTPATSTATVQISPRTKWCGTAWNSTSSASETDCLFIEVLPATVAGTTTATMKFGYIDPSGTVTYPLTLSSAGVLTAASSLVSGSNVQSATSSYFLVNARAAVGATASKQMVLLDSAVATGAELNLGSATLGTCTGGTITTGSHNFAGGYTGNTSSSCIVNFGTPSWTNAPFCVAMSIASTTHPRVSATAVGSITITGGVSGEAITYGCWGRIGT